MNTRHFGICGQSAVVVATIVSAAAFHHHELLTTPWFGALVGSVIAFTAWDKIEKEVGSLMKKGGK